MTLLEKIELYVDWNIGQQIRKAFILSIIAKRKKLNKMKISKEATEQNEYHELLMQDINLKIYKSTKTFLGILSIILTNDFNTYQLTEFVNLLLSTNENSTFHIRVIIVICIK